MPVYEIKSTDGKEFKYGFFKYAQSYFLSREHGNGHSCTYLVGGISDVPGTWNNMFAALVKHKCIPPMAKFLELLKTVGPTEEVIGKALPAKEENRWYGGIVISADGVQAIDFIEGNTITVKEPTDTRFDDGDGQSMTDSYLQGY